MRAYKRDQERRLERTRLVLFEMINGNPNIKKNSKPRKPSDLFELSIDVKVKIEPTKITSEQAETINKMGYNIPKAFIKDE